MWPPERGLTTVRLSATAVASSGMPLLPPTFTRATPYGLTGRLLPPIPERVSSSRVGACGVNFEPEAWTSTLLVAVTLLSWSVSVTVTLCFPTSAKVCFEVSSFAPVTCWVSVLPSPQSMSTLTLAPAVALIWDARLKPCAEVAEARRSTARPALPFAPAASAAPAACGAAALPDVRTVRSAGLWKTADFAAAAVTASIAAAALPRRSAGWSAAWAAVGTKPMTAATTAAEIMTR